MTSISLPVAVAPQAVSDTSEAAASGSTPSPGQRALWFLERLAPEGAAYNIVVAGWVQGRVEPPEEDALRRALAALVGRHPLLRASFPERSGEPVLVIDEEVCLDFLRVEVEDEGDPAFLQRLLAEAYRPFDLAHGPLLRVRLFSRAPACGSRTVAFLLAVHHLVVDFWSLAVIARELAALYRQESRGGALDLGPPPADYREYVRHQAEVLAGSRGEALWEHWGQALVPPLPVLDLPTDYRRPPVQTYAGGSRSARLEARESGDLRSLGRRNRASLFTTLLAIFQAVLHRHSGQRDLLVGSPTAGRGSSRWAGVVGYFVNPVVLRGEVGGEMSFAELLASTGPRVSAALSHQELPFPWLAERLQPMRDPARSPVFQAVFTLQKAGRREDRALAEFALGWPEARVDLGGFKLAPLPLGEERAPFELALVAAEPATASEGLTLSLQYNADLFDGTTAARMIGHFTALVRAVVRHPDRPLADLGLLSVAESQQLLREWNDTGPGVASDRWVHERFAAQARRAPAAVAVVQGGEWLSYGELDARANRLAWRLRTLGVGPEEGVGVCLERSLLSVICLLAVLKSGGAFVPLDPAYPTDRLAFTLKDAGACVLLTVERLARRLPELAGGAPVLCLDEPALLGRGLAAAPALDLAANDQAYIIYTSGSTGRPKGSILHHGGLANVITWLTAVLAPTAADRGSHLSGPAFDATVLELWPVLTSGASVRIPEPEEVLSSSRLSRWLAAEAIALAFLPTPVLEGWLASSLPAELALRWVFTGGDKLRRRPEAGAGFRLINLYGPTENTVVITWGVVERRGMGAPSIGRPIVGVQIYLLDRWARPVPSGAVGELYVGGANVSRGYLGRPELTADRFVPDPFGVVPGSRLYRTGDLVRTQSDGSLEFLGRVDYQVKVRGQRLELGEIETLLSGHPEIREVVVLALADASGGKRLVAFLVARREARTEEVRSFLKEKLPLFMVPSAFVWLPVLPLTPNGKVDRIALEQLEAAGIDSGGASVAPRNPLEELLAGVWADLLRVEKVGIDQSFFDLGGHSLLAAQLTARLRDSLGLEVPLRTLFENPTVAGLAAALGPGTAVAASTLPPIVPVPRQGPLPLSFAQERLWFLNQLEPDNPAYHLPGALLLTGRLDRASLAASLEILVDRHEALRTTFSAVDSGGAVQVVGPVPEIALPLIELGSLPAPERAGELRRLSATEARRPFDLVTGPVLRAALLGLAADEHLLLLSMHHIASDGWSIGVFVRELSECYRALLAGSAPVLPILPVQYADFAVWQRRWLSGEVLEEGIAWGRELLAGAPTFLDLPTDRPRPAEQRLRGDQLDFQLPVDLVAAGLKLGRQRGATQFMLLLSVLAALLARLSGEEDLVLGAPIANRTHRELEGLIGFFVNTLALRVDLAGDPSFTDLLAQVRRTTLAAYAHQDLPFEKLVEALQPERSLAHAPLLQVMLVLENTPAEPFLLPGLTVERLDLPVGAARLDLTLVLTPTPSGLTGCWEYDRDLFDRSTITRLAAGFERLLASAVADPESPLSALASLGEVEIQQLREWGAGDPLAGLDTGENAGACLHQLFSAQVARTPLAEALVVGTERLTYEDLDRRARRLAAHLAGLGVGPEVRVGVGLGRSAGLVVALLSVLEAGGAYVPLDPAYPAARLAHMLADSRAAVLLTEEGLDERFPGGGGIRRVYLDPVTGEVIGVNLATDRVPASGVQPGNLAYLIYTSGSTGRPKAVALEHRSAVGRMRWARRTFTDEELSGVLFGTSVCFDLSVFELFVPLSWGGRVILAENALALPGLPAAGEVRLLNTVPSVMAELVREGRLPPGITTVNLAGEPLPRPLAEAIHGTGTVRRLQNLYGPSEDTTYSTWARVAPAAPGETRVPAIGRPLAATRAHVLDRRGQPVPLGAAGELHLGGAGLARGYFGRPELTAERFVPDPFAERGGERLYRTGDLVRYRLAGDLLFLGRIDHQVKVRGFRVELGEIEAALGEHEAVRRAVVVLRDSRLVAYVESDPAAAAGLGEWLRARLPEPLVPSGFVALEALPLTPSGKIDRNALPSFSSLPAGRSAPAGRERGPLEEVLAGIWADLLDLDPGVGLAGEDDFFTLGGHSLLATRLASRLRAAFGVELPLKRLFEASTLTRMALAVGELRARASGPALPPIRPLPEGAFFPLSFAQERLWFLDQLMPGPVYNMPAALLLRGPLEATVLHRTLGELKVRHETLRTTFAERAGQPVQVIAPPGTAGPDLPLVDLSGLSEERRGEEVHRRAREEAERPFDLAAGPLLRAVLVRLAPEEHVVLFTLHHIIADGWSMGVLVREVAALYRAALLGAPADLPPLAVQFRDFAVWQREWLSGEVLAAQLAWWRERLAGAPALLELPADRPRPSVQRFRGHRRPLDLAQGLGVRALGSRVGATPFMTLLAAFQLLLSRLSGQEDVTVGSPIAGRGRSEVEGLIGFFVNTLALRSNRSGGLAFVDLLGEVRETTLDAYAHQDLPFERLVEELRPGRDLAYAPLFQVMFVFQNAPPSILRLPGLEIAPLDIEVGIAKFDLTLTFAETAAGLAGGLSYNRDLFDATTAERLAGRFQNLLAAALAEPGRPVVELPFLSVFERHQLLSEWSAGRREYPGSDLLHELFAEQAARLPAEPAVWCAGSFLTYGELDARADRLAARLRAVGVGPESVVGLALPRSFALIVGVLGTLKAGGAYLALDPGLPAERLAFLVADADVRALLATASTAGLLPAGTLPRLLLDDDGVGLPPAPPLPPLRPAASMATMSPDHPAYVIYTSGSTGKPKGVVVPHRAIAVRMRFSRVEGPDPGRSDDPEDDALLRRLGLRDFRPPPGRWADRAAAARRGGGPGLSPGPRRGARGHLPLLSARAPLPPPRAGGPVRPGYPPRDGDRRRDGAPRASGPLPFPDARPAREPLWPHGGDDLGDRLAVRSE